MNIRHDMDKKILVKFGHRVRKFRLSARLSQEKLAELSGVHRNYIGGIERAEKNPTIITINKISKALGLPMSKLLKDVE